MLRRLIAGALPLGAFQQARIVAHPARQLGPLPRGLVGLVLRRVENPQLLHTVF